MPGNPQTLFISDLHLCELRPEKLALFEQFIARITGGIDALHILGDLFEFWHGDDDLMHGDLLCTDDTAYQRMRRIFNLRRLQWLFVCTPLAFRRALSSRIRQFSMRENAGKSPQIMDVSPASVIDVVRKYDVDLLIHGHTHRPAIHTINIDGRAAQRIVLGDWYTQESVLVSQPDKLQLLSIKDFIERE